MKKSWHPQRSGNVAATQKAEAEAIAERKRLQLRLQEIEEERRKEEIQKQLEAAGGKRKVDRVEWMYAGPTDGQAGAAESEAYLLGKRRIDKLLVDNEVKNLSKQPSQDVAAIPTINNARDVAAKIREDPLLAIKRQEQQAYEAMMNDPIKRRRLLAAMGIDDAQAKDKRKEEKREKHRHHHRSHRHHGDGREGDRSSHRRRSDSRDRSRSPRRARSGSPWRDRSRDARKHRSRSPRRERSRSPRRHDDEGHRTRRRRDSPDRKRYKSGSDEGRREGSRPRRTRDDRIKEESRSVSPPPRRREPSPERDETARRSSPRGRNGGRDSGPYRARRDYDEDSRPRQNGRGPAPTPTSAVPDKNQADEERARKLAAMQEAATDLDKIREQRLAAIEAADRAQREADDLVRQRNKKYGGNAGFTNALHSRAAELKLADRLERR